MLSRLNSDLFVECVLINNYSAQNAGKTRQAKKKEGEDEIALSVLRCVKFNSTLASHEEFRALIISGSATSGSLKVDVDTEI